MSIEKEKELFLEWLKKEKPMMYEWGLYGIDEYETKVDYMFLAWQASANREGYKLVPVEPTLKMLEDASYEHVLHGASYSGIYKAMIGEETK